jgi:hypothetical protein
MEEVTGDVEPPMKREDALHFIPTLQKRSVLILEKRHKQYSYIRRVVRFLWVKNKLISGETFSMLRVALCNLEYRNSEILNT